jgi:hypothetical protein
MRNYNSFRQSMLLHEQQVESRKQILEMEQPWRVNLEHAGSFLECFWRRILKSQVVRLEE